MSTKHQKTDRGQNGETLARVRAVSRAVAILRCFTPGQMYMSLGEIASATDLDAGTTRRLLVTLRDEGLIGQAVDGRYHLTMQVWRLVSAVPDGRTLRDHAMDHIRELANTTGHTVLLSILRGNQAICLAREHGNSPVQVRWWPIGEAMPLNCGAAPRLLLAHMPEDECNAVLEGPLVALSRKSITNPFVLREMLDDVRHNGWSLATDDVLEGLSALAAPIRNPSGAVVAAVSLGGLTSSIVTANGSPNPDLLATLKQACAVISDQIPS